MTEQNHRVEIEDDRVRFLDPDGDAWISAGALVHLEDMR